MSVREMVALTLALELLGALFLGAVLLVGWLVTDGLIDLAPWSRLALMGPCGLVVGYFRRRPPRRLRAVLAGMLSFALVCFLVVTAAERWLPGLAESTDLDGVLALVVAFVPANGVFAFVAGPPTER
ncbi:hypothetical protein [Kitasatospora sp. NPDC057541]|uniref:hypothetical protein n=1 Tax=unclassified Kitasatospora TaxID=2633591 RepID=UPI003675ADD7